MYQNLPWDIIYTSERNGVSDMKRVIWIILDSVGMGELPDAAAFGDKGANTIVHTWEYNGGLDIPNMLKLGYGNIEGMTVLPKTDIPSGAYGRCMELSNGKDTTVGHWEMTGIISKKHFLHLKTVSLRKLSVSSLIKQA